MRRPSRQRTPSKGASAVEFALVLPLLVLLVMGIIDWGYYFYSEQIVVNAAREGARAGSLDAPSDAMAQADAASAANAYLVRGGLDAGKSTVNVTLAADSVRVRVQYATGSLTGLSDLVLPAAASADAEMRRQP